jgi:hypothetical protein
MQPQSHTRSPIKFLCARRSSCPATSPWRRGLFLLLFAVVAIIGLRADDQNRTILTFGTTAIGPGGEHAAYVVWEPIGFHVPPDHAFAIYSKAGESASTEPYVFQGVARIQTSPAVIQNLLTRSVLLGQDLVALESDLMAMFAGIIPVDTFGLAQKLSVVIRGSLADQRYFDNLMLLSRLHAGVRLCLGMGHAEPIPGPAGTRQTFEVRTHDPSTGRDLAVVGRVTLTAGAPVVLPAPGAPVEIPEESPQGHLSARFRWATPDSLRRLSVLQFGFNVYRVDAAFAVANGLDQAPPDIGLLLGLVADGTVAHRVNLTPILTARLFNQAEAANLQLEPENYYFADDNERFNQDAPLPREVFHNGATFFYYVTARDLLGRDGMVSDGTFVLICDRMPPPAPRRLRADNSFHFQQVEQGGQIVMREDQRLVVSWEQVPAEENPVAYYIYRWNSLPEKNELLVSGAAQPIAGPIPHVPDERRLSYRDDGPGAPTVESDAGRTFWYTVVAMDDGACDGNLSPHSAPAFGVLRDWAGPEPLEIPGTVRYTCVLPTVQWLANPETVSIQNPNPDRRFFRLETERGSKGIAWVEFSVADPHTQALLPLGRVYFDANNDVATLTYHVDLTPSGPNAMREFYCRVGTFGGQISNQASTTLLEPPNSRQMVRVRFLASVDPWQSSGFVTVAIPCRIHDPNPAGGDGTDDAVVPLVVDLYFPPGTREWRLYRRIDDGPSTLLRQGNGHPEMGDVQAMIEDYDLPANAATICYYVQYLDEHGNPGPMTRIDCVETVGRTELPTPILNTLVATGTEDQPRVRVEWFCAPHGVERFQVWVLGLPVPVPLDFVDDSALVVTVPVGFNVPQAGQIIPQFRVFKTPRIGPGFGQAPMFSVEADVAPGNRYVVFIQALSPHGKASPKSNTESFVWSQEVEPTEDVAWPARPLPLVGDASFPDVIARFIEPDMFGVPFPFEGVGLRIGEIPEATHLFQTPNVPGVIRGQNDPVEHLYRSVVNDEPIFDLVAYRYMVPNEAFPEVSGDVIQVTPFMEEIAFRRESVTGIPSTIIYDPFVRLFPEAETASGPHGFYLIDTQPLVQGARYQYLLVRFHKVTKEIVEVLLPDPVDIPEEE